MWERILFQSFELLTDSNDEPLVATIDFVFKAASQCQHLPKAVRFVRVRLKSLGLHVSPCVLDFLSKTINSWGDVVETILRDIDYDEDYGESCIALKCGIFLFGEPSTASTGLHMIDEQAFRASRHFSDIYILLEMLSIPCLAVEVSQTFERAVARGAIGAQSVALVLESLLSQRLNNNSRTENFQHSDGATEEDAEDAC